MEADNNKTISSTKSILFSRQLGVNSTEIIEPSEPIAPVTGLDIRELGLKVDRARKKPRTENPKSTFSISFSKKVENSNENDNRFITLDKIRENSKKLSDHRTSKLPRSVTKPKEMIIGPNQIYVTNLQEIIEKFRIDTSHAIIKQEEITQSLVDTSVGIIKRIQCIGDSLKIVELETSNGNLHKIGLVCLWNEWIDIRIGDKIYVQDSSLENDHNNEDIQWCLKWKKLVKS
jgi:hypothetical protein